MGGDDDDVQMEKKIEDVNIEEEEEEVYEGLLHAKAKGCLWFEQLQRFIPVQTLYSYAVPRIVCIGEESSGKSSTLERIAEMSFFPTDRHLCTRMPIELKLRHQDKSEIKEKSGSPHASSYVMMHLIRGPGSKLSDDVNNGPFSTEDVASKVKEWMFSIVDGNSQDSGRPVGVTDDRLVIELYSTRKMNLDLIDLPGIVAGRTEGEPDDIVEKTRNLTERYLQEPHTLVVLVVSNRAERIRNSQAFELVQRYEKQKHTVGVLTMVDRCVDSRRPHDPFWELKERLNGTSSDLPDLGAGYVALKNRDTIVSAEHSETDTIVAAYEEELQWFNTHLPEFLDESRACCGGIDNLLSKLLILLHNYTDETWSSLEHKRLVREHERVVTEKKSLGEMFTDDLGVLLNCVSERKSGVKIIGDYADIESTMKKIENSLSLQAFSKSGFPTGLPNKWFKMESSSTTTRWISCATHPEPFYRDKACLFQAIISEVQKALEELFQSPVERTLDVIFAPNQLPLLLDRFSLLREGVEFICREWVQTVSSNIQSNLLHWLSLDQVFSKKQAAPYSLRESPSNFLHCLLINGELRARLVDLTMTELMLNPLHVVLNAQSLRLKLHDWWKSLGHEVNGFELLLCQEIQSVTERRAKLHNESDALDLMIQTLRDVFPSKFNNKFTFSTTKEKTDFPIFNFGKPLTRAEPTFKFGTFNIGSPEEKPRLQK